MGLLTGIRGESESAGFRMPLAGGMLIATLLLVVASLRAWCWELPEKDRSPGAVVCSADGRWLVVANQTARSVALVDVGSGKVTCEVEVGEGPMGLALTGDGRRVAVTTRMSGDLVLLRREADQLQKIGQVHLGFEPWGVAIDPLGEQAYVALATGHGVAVVDLEPMKVLEKIAVGRWPRFVALTPDGKRLAVGASGDGGVSVVDTATRKLLFQENFSGINLGQMQVSADGESVYLPWSVYRNLPIIPNNIRQGWVLASRIARVRLGSKVRREAIALDPQGKAVADPHGLALSPDQQWLACTAAGTHELLLMRVPGLPFQDYGGPGDHIDADLLKDPERFTRIPLGGRPMGLTFAPDGKHIYVANYLLNAIQEIDVATRQVSRTIALGSNPEPTLARKGAAIFYDGQRSLDQWYSCHTCHYEGHVNRVSMDTKNDGRFGNFKTVLSLRNLEQTAPYFWHGWESDLDRALTRSLKETMQGPEPTVEDVRALRAFLGTLKTPPNPHRQADGTMTDAAKRGEQVFRSDVAGCARCHKGPAFTDKRVHETGIEDPGDVFKGYNPPSLLGVYDRVRYLHDGRVQTLEQLLIGPHNPVKLSGMEDLGDLNDQQRRDLIAYLLEL